jgi:hypothetical protein
MPAALLMLAVLASELPGWLAGRWTATTATPGATLTFAERGGAMQGVVIDPAPGRAGGHRLGREIARYEVRARRGALSLRLWLRREGPQPFTLHETRCQRPGQRICFERTHYARPGPDEVEISLEDDGRLHTRIGIGPQHGAKVFEEMDLVRVEPAGP